MQSMISKLQRGPMEDLDMCIYGAFCYMVMPFGLSTAPSTLKRFISREIGDINQGKVFKYLDDILLATESISEN
jgi:hypothetical protein